MTTLLDALLKPAPPAKTGKPCVIARTINDLPDPYRSTLTNLVDTPATKGGVSADEIGARLRAAGLPGSATAVTRHRLGTCTCGSRKEHGND